MTRHATSAQVYFDDFGEKCQEVFTASTTYYDGNARHHCLLCESSKNQLLLIDCVNTGHASMIIGDNKPPSSEAFLGPSSVIQHSEHDDP